MMDMKTVKKENEFKRTKKTIKRTIKYIYKISPGYFIISLLLTILMGTTSAMSILGTRLLINGIVEITKKESYNFILILIIYGVINFTIQFLQYINEYVGLKHQLKIDYKMSMDRLKKSKELRLQDFEDSEIYDILSRAEMEGQIKVYAAYRNMSYIMIQIASIASISAIILSWNSYVFLLILIIPIISTVINTRIGYSNYKIRMERMSEVRKTSYISYLLSNDIACKEVKTYDIGSYLINLFSKIRLKIQNQDLFIARKKTIWSIVISLIEEIVGVFIIFKVVKMTGRILVGDIVAYINSLGIIQANLSGFLDGVSGIYNDILYIEQFFKLLDLNVEESQERIIEIEELEEIEFKNVYYTYAGSQDITLSHINIKINRNELIGIVGKNGSGKTTFIKLLCGFYDNYQGDILINGIELKKINPDGLRRKMGIIFQDFNKYEMTLRENIGFGKIDEMNNDEKILKVLEEVSLKEKIDRFPDKIDTQMGKWFQGEELSKGQWQRVALGRAFMRDADIYILDEPTSSLDPISEKDIFKLMVDKSNEKIGIFITHRVDNIAELDPRIIVFAEGKIIGDGKNEQLLKTCNEYAEFLGKETEYMSNN